MLTPMHWSCLVRLLVWSYLFCRWDVQVKRDLNCSMWRALSMCVHFYRFVCYRRRSRKVRAREADIAAATVYFPRPLGTTLSTQLRVISILFALSFSVKIQCPKFQYHPREANNGMFKLAIGIFSKTGKRSKSDFSTWALVLSVFKKHISKIPQKKWA
jgi:hypothetical protein